MADFWAIAHTIATELVVGTLVFASLCIFFHPVARWWKARALHPRSCGKRARNRRPGQRLMRVRSSTTR